MTIFKSYNFSTVKEAFQVPPNATTANSPHQLKTYPLQAAQNETESIKQDSNLHLKTAYIEHNKTHGQNQTEATEKLTDRLKNFFLKSNCCGL